MGRLIMLEGVRQLYEVAVLWTWRRLSAQGWGLDIVQGVDVWIVPTLSGTGAELTPIAVLRGPEKKLGINTPLVTA